MVLHVLSTALSRGPWHGILLGVLGGMGPAATASFLGEVCNATEAHSDQDHLPYVTLSLPQIPDRTDAILNMGPSPLPLLRSGLRQLLEWGATLLAVPCNTAHAYIHEIPNVDQLPLVDIVQSVTKAVRDFCPEGAWLTGTVGLVASQMYQDEAEHQGARLFQPTVEECADLMSVVELVKANQVTEAGTQYRNVYERLHRRRDLPIVSACTELPLAYRAAGLPPEGQISSIAVLAADSVRLARQQLRDRRDLQ